MALVLSAVALLVVAASASGASRAGCPAPARAAALPRWSPGGSLRGTFEGGSRTQSATIRYAPGAPAYCGFFLVVAGRSYAIEQHLANKQLRVGEAADVVPRVEAAIDLGLGRDLVVAADSEGASNLSVAVYGIAGRRLVQVAGGPRSLFGFAEATTTVRCATTGVLRELEYYLPSSTGTTWVFELRTYRLRSMSFVLVGRRRWHGSAKAMTRRAAAAGMDGPQFGGCIVAGTIRP